VGGWVGGGWAGEKGGQCELGRLGWLAAGWRGQAGRLVGWSGAVGRLVGMAAHCSPHGRGPCSRRRLPPARAYAPQPRCRRSSCCRGRGVRCAAHGGQGQGVRARRLTVRECGGGGVDCCPAPTPCLPRAHTVPAPHQPRANAAPNPHLRPACMRNGSAWSGPTCASSGLSQLPRSIRARLISAWRSSWRSTTRFASASAAAARARSTTASASATCRASSDSLASSNACSSACAKQRNVVGLTGSRTLSLSLSLSRV
jgi:hypothetical protein